MITENAPLCQTKNNKIPVIELQNWQKSLTDSKLTIKDLLNYLSLTPDDFKSHNNGLLIQEKLDFPLRAPLPFISRMKKGDINDPLLQQVLPFQLENKITKNFSFDPLNESEKNILPGVIHKYKNRVLMLATAACAINCRYCFRRHFPYKENQINRKEWDEAFHYINNNKEIDEIILSGGDPLTNNNNQIKWFIDNLKKIKHIKTLRIHSRLPIVIPERIDKGIIDCLNSWENKKVFVIHSNHANEIDYNVKKSIEKIKKTDALLLNQSVLLKGVNDKSSDLIMLSKRLFSIGVLPYYVHLLDKVQGAAHFDVCEDDAKKIMSEVRDSLPGYLVPKLVKELPNKKSKTLIVPEE